WSLAEGGFEGRVVHGALSRGRHDLDVTAFDLETLRERRGEWAYLPVEPPFRIAGTVSIVVCEVDRAFPHVLFKRAGRGDDLLAQLVAPRRRVAGTEPCASRCSPICTSSSIATAARRSRARCPSPATCWCSPATSCRCARPTRSAASSAGSPSGFRTWCSCRA